MLVGVADPTSPQRCLRSRRPAGLPSMAALMDSVDGPPVSPSGRNLPQPFHSPQRGVRDILSRRSGLANMADAIFAAAVQEVGSASCSSIDVSSPTKSIRRFVLADHADKLRNSNHGDSDDDSIDEEEHHLGHVYISGHQSQASISTSISAGDHGGSGGKKSHFPYESTAGDTRVDKPDSVWSLSIQLWKLAVILLFVCTIFAVHEKDTSGDATIHPNLFLHGPQERDLLYNPLGSSAARIIAGTDVTDPARYPYYTLFYNSAVCGGALIAPDLVLTAAHCLNAGATKDPLDPTILADNHVWVGRSSIDATRTEAHGARYTVVDEVQHSLYKPGNFSFDIMMVKLSEKSPYPPVKVNLDATFTKLEKKNLHVIGFGDYNPAMSVAEVPTTLQEIVTEHVDHAACRELYEAGEEDFLANYPDVLPQVLTKDQLCAERSDGGTCAGDSGGPLLVKGDNGQADILVGLVAWHRDGCANNLYPDVYTNIHYFSDWIVAMACEMSEDHDFDCTRGDE